MFYYVVRGEVEEVWRDIFGWTVLTICIWGELLCIGKHLLVSDGLVTNYELSLA